MKSSIAFLLGCFLISCGFVHAATLTFDPDNGTINGSTSTTWKGVTIKKGKLLSSAQEFLVLGDLVLASGDTLTATSGSTKAVRLIVAGDCIVSENAIIDVSGVGSVGRAGGGSGGTSGVGAVGGAGGISVGGNNKDGIGPTPGASGSDGTAGGNGGRGHLNFIPPLAVGGAGGNKGTGGSGGIFGKDGTSYRFVEPDTNGNEYDGAGGQGAVSGGDGDNAPNPDKVGGAGAGGDGTNGSNGQGGHSTRPHLRRF